MRKAIVAVLILVFMTGCNLRAGGNGTGATSTTIEAGGAGEHTFPLATDETMTLTINPAEGLDAVLELYDPAGQLILEQDDAFTSEPETLIFTAPSAGTYILRVRGYGGEAGSYTLLNEGDTPMLIPTAVIGGDETDSENSLPPTWTPIPPGSGAGTTPGGTTAETPAAPAPPAGNQETYTVRAGDTLAEIAARFGVTIQALVQANNIENVDYIEVGQVLVIPR